MNRSSLTEETPATPGWAEVAIDKVFAPLGDAAIAVKNAYADCLAGVRGSVDTDAGHDRCRRQALEALRETDVDLPALDRALQALEADLSSGT